MEFTKREMLGVVLLLVMGLVAFFAWQGFFVTMVTPGISDIWRPTMWFFLLVTLFFLGTVLWVNSFFRIAGAALYFLPGLFFMRSWEYIVVSTIAAIFIFWSSVAIARETEERVRFRFFKSARVGQFLFVVGFSLALSGGYYVFLKDALWEELVPRFRIGEEMTGILFKVAGTINPSFSKLSEGTATVDEFLLSLEQGKLEETPLNQASLEKRMSGQDIQNTLPQSGWYSEGEESALSSRLDQEKMAQELFLESGREQVATLVGRPVGGDEKISDVLSLALQNKLITILRGGKAAPHISSQAVPFFLSLLLFLTLLSFTSIFAPVCILGAELIFLLILWAKWLKIGTFTVEQEKLVD